MGSSLRAMRRPARPRASSSRRRGTRLKRVLDVLFALCGIIALSPLLIAVAVAIRVTMGSPVLFRHRRPGLHGAPFTLLKFRSMVDARGADGEPLPQDQRLTRLGILIRRTSIDELPGLWNVLRGDMAMVGPRPLLMEYLPLYSATQMRRHEVRPGLTGLAQVVGRHTLGWDERFALDVWYVDNRSLRLDARIMRDTFKVLFAGQGHVDPGMPDFMFKGNHVVAEADDGSRALPMEATGEVGRAEMPFDADTRVIARPGDGRESVAPTAVGGQQNAPAEVR